MIQATITDLEHKLEAAEDALVDSQQATRLAVTERDKLQATQARQREKYRNLQTRLDTAEHALATSQSDMQTVRSEHDTQTQALHREIDTLKSDAQISGNSALQTAQAQWDMEKSALVNEFSAQSHALRDTFTAERLALEHDLDQVRARADFAISEGVRSGTEDMKSRLSVSIEQNRALQEKIAQLQADSMAAGQEFDRRISAMQSDIDMAASPALKTAQEQVNIIFYNIFVRRDYTCT